MASRVAVIGVNGAGKSTMIKLMVGELLPNEGEGARRSPAGHTHRTRHCLSLCPRSHFCACQPRKSVRKRSSQPLSRTPALSTPHQPRRRRRRRRSLDAGSPVIQRHPNMRLAYVAQHAFHHIENHLEKTPVRDVCAATKSIATRSIGSAYRLAI
eukprot:6212115-Pleurochrysis_carterae.AAC.1